MPIRTIRGSAPEGGTAPLGLIFEDFVHFLKKKKKKKKIKQIWTKYPIYLVRNIPRISKIYFSRGHCCEVTAKNVRKSIFSMF